MKIDIHADDYALTLNTSLDILKCLKAGKLDSMSIVPNMGCFGECMDLLYNSIPELPFFPLASVHVNLIEGVSLFKGNELVPPFERMSWGKLYSFNWLLGKNNPIRMSINEEVYEQISKGYKEIMRCIRYAEKCGIECKQNGARIDSHQHTHMIPIVWEACINAVDRLNVDLEYIRNSFEPLNVFFRKKDLISSYKLVNIIKNRILFFHSRKVDNFCDCMSLDKMFLWGIIMSGNMDINRVSYLYEDMKNYSEKKNRTLEILFHPGTVISTEINDELNPGSVVRFYLGDGRKIEQETIMNFFD